MSDGVQIPCVVENGDTPNVALVREAYAAFNARDADRLCELMSPEGELYPYAIAESRAKGYHGHDGLRQYISDVQALFADFVVEIDHYSDAAEDVVYVRGHLRGHTKDDQPVDLPVGWLWTIRDGLLLRMQADPRSS
jgi:ketosteroid isomerase-like protein